MTFKWNGPAIADEINRLTGAGLTAATIFTANKAKEILSVPAPRVRLTDKTGAAYYRAGWTKGGPGIYGLHYATSYKRDRSTGALTPTRVHYEPSPATRGEPPRKLSGRLRSSVAYEFLNHLQDSSGGIYPQTGRVGTNVKYGRYLEHHKNDHRWLGRVVTDLKDEIARVLWGAMN